MLFGEGTETSKVYFSERNEDTVYINHFSGLLAVQGTGDLDVGDTIVSPDEKDDWIDEYDTLSIKEGITEIRKGYLEFFRNITCLIISRSVTDIAVSPKAVKMLHKNNVLIRGEYNTYAEEFSRQLNLRFLHCDIFLAEISDKFERDVITLRFHDDGAPDIHHNIFSSGSSAGSYGGGEVASELPPDFYVGCTMEKFVKNFRSDAHEQLMANEKLRRFLDNANKRHGSR